jgi:hypothetical protein
MTLVIETLRCNWLGLLKCCVYSYGNPIPSFSYWIPPVFTMEELDAARL